jgi:hypothetical protein
LTLITLYGLREAGERYMGYRRTLYGVRSLPLLTLKLLNAPIWELSSAPIALWSSALEPIWELSCAPIEFI